MWSEKVLLALLLTQQPIPRYGRGTGLLSPLLQLLHVLLLLVETQPPIVPKNRSPSDILKAVKSGEAERAFYIVYDLKTIQRIVFSKKPQHVIQTRFQHVMLLNRLTHYQPWGSY